MFTSSNVSAVDEGEVVRHSDINSFSKEFPNYLLDQAVDFAASQLDRLLQKEQKQQQEKQQQQDSSQETTTITIKKNAKIAVQLYDESLQHSVRLISELQTRTETKILKQHQQQNLNENENNNNNQQKKKVEIEGKCVFFILADSTFAPCCADQVTALRNGADAIIHFGPTCFSRSNESIPVAFLVSPWNVYFFEESSSSSILAIPLLEEKRQQQCRIALKLVKKTISKLPCCSSSSDSSSCCCSVVLVVSAGLQQEQLEQFTLDFKSIGGIDEAIEKKKINSFTVAVCGQNKNNDDNNNNNNNKEEENVWNIDGAKFPVSLKGHQIIFYISASSSSQKNHVKQEEKESDDHSGPLHQLALIEYWNSAKRMQQEEEDSSSYNNIDIQWLTHLVPLNSISAVTNAENTSNNNNNNASSRLVSEAAKDVSRRINQRMRNIEALSHASSVGLLVLSLSMSQQREMLAKLQHILRKGGKRVYVVFVGHLNEFKLANFADSIDLFVSLACPNSRPAHFANKSDNFHVPLLFPAEVMLWYERDIKQISEEEMKEKFLNPDLFTTRAKEEEKENENERVETSSDNTSSAAAAASAASSSTTITNNNMNINSSNEGTMITTPALHISTTRSNVGTLQKFQEKSWQGLAPRYGQDAVQDEVVEGKEGIARNYDSH